MRFLCIILSSRPIVCLLDCSTFLIIQLIFVAHLALVLPLIFEASLELDQEVLNNQDITIQMDNASPHTGQRYIEELNYYSEQNGINVTFVT